METEIHLSKNGAGRIEIHVGGSLLATTKDGGSMIQRVDRILGQHHVRRATGFSLAGRTFVAAGADFR